MSPFQGDGLSITSSINDQTVILPSEEALEAVRSFAERVRQFLIDRGGGIQKNPAWGQWFPRE
jgi:hypothetical protein